MGVEDADDPWCAAGSVIQCNVGAHTVCGITEEMLVSSYCI